MQFALLFIVAFLAGLGIYRFLYNWVPAVFVPMAIFTLSTLLDFEAQQAWTFSLVFGLPIVFVGSLLGAYVIEIRKPDNESQEPSEFEQ